MRYLRSDNVLRLTAGLVGTQAVTTLLGFVFWTLAARRYNVREVGLAGAAVSAMTFLGTVGMLGLGTLLIAELPRAAPGHRRLLVRSALAAAVAAGLVLGGAAVAVLAPFDVPLSRFTAGLAPAVLFSVGVGLTSVSLVLDQAVLAVGSGFLQLRRNAWASATKLAALAALAATAWASGLAVLAAWQVGTLISLGAVALATGRRPAGSAQKLVSLGLLRSLRQAAMSHHALNLTLQGPSMLLPVLLVLLQSATDNAYFTTALLVVGFVYVLPFALTIALFADNAGDEAALVLAMRRTIPLGLVFAAAGCLMLQVLGPTILASFGARYVHGATATLRILALGGIPLVLKDHYVALRRSQSRTREAARLTLLGGVLEVAAAAVGAVLAGSEGLAFCWIGALVLESLLFVRPLAGALSFWPLRSHP